MRSDLVKQIAEGITKTNECLSHMESVTEYSKGEAKDCHNSYEMKNQSRSRVLKMHPVTGGHKEMLTALGV